MSDATRRLRALIVQHEEPTPPGLVGQWLEEHAVEVDVLRIDIDDREPDPRIQIQHRRQQLDL
jgi:hypothetical protein